MCRKGAWLWRGGGARAVFGVSGCGDMDDVESRVYLLLAHMRSSVRGLTPVIISIMPSSFVQNPMTSSG